MSDRIYSRFSFRETKIDGPRRCSVASTMFDDPCPPFVPRHTSSDLCDAWVKGHATPSFDHVFFRFRFDRCLVPAWALTLTAAVSTRNVCTEEVWVSISRGYLRGWRCLRNFENFFIPSSICYFLQKDNNRYYCMRCNFV